MTSDEGRADNYQIFAYVLVARPHDLDQWHDLVNSLRQQDGRQHLATAVCIPIPPGPCPWCEEYTLLSNSLQALKLLAEAPGIHHVHQGTIDHVQQRIDLLSAPRGSPGLTTQLFFCNRDGRVGEPTAERITPHSLFGEDLTEASAYAAMATAAFAAREEAAARYSQGHGRSWSWEVHKIFNAYHDPVLQAAFLRSVRPHEMTGADRARTMDAVSEIHFGSSHPQLRQAAFLAAEHALAAIQGKYPHALQPAVLEHAYRVLQEWNSDVLPVLRSLHSLQALTAPFPA
jgi:hypothetical protein